MKDGPQDSECRAAEIDDDETAEADERQEFFIGGQHQERYHGTRLVSAYTTQGFQRAKVAPTADDDQSGRERN